jgi:hypothetical protein
LYAVHVNVSSRLGCCSKMTREIADRGAFVLCRRCPRHPSVLRNDRGQQGHGREPPRRTPSDPSIQRKRIPKTGRSLYGGAHRAALSRRLARPPLAVPPSPLAGCRRRCTVPAWVMGHAGSLGCTRERRRWRCCAHRPADLDKRRPEQRGPRLPGEPTGGRGHSHDPNSPSQLMLWVYFVGAGVAGGTESLPDLPVSPLPPWLPVSPLVP